MRRRSVSSLIVLLAAFVSAAPATSPSVTHTLVLDDFGSKGHAPMRYSLSLPDDWQTTGTDGKRAIPSANRPHAVEWLDLKIDHHPDGTVAFDFSPNTLDARYGAELHRIDDAHYEGTWSSAAMFGPNGRATSFTGAAHLAVVSHPSTRHS